MPDLLLLLLCVPIFLLSGLVKGTVGMGQPATAIGLLTFFVPLDEAVVIVLVPGLITNAIQTFKGPPVWGMLRRLRIFFVMNVVFAWIGVKILATGEIMALTAVLGVLLILHAGGMWVTNWRVISRRAERILQVPVGSLNGLFVGMTGATPFPGVPYLQSLGMEREELIQAMGAMFLIAAITLAFGYVSEGLLTREGVTASVFAVVPSTIGLYLGQRIRHRLSQEAFRKTFLVVLFALGVYITATNI